MRRFKTQPDFLVRRRCQAGCHNHACTVSTTALSDGAAVARVDWGRRATAFQVRPLTIERLERSVGGSELAEVVQLPPDFLAVSRGIQIDNS